MMRSLTTLLVLAAFCGAALPAQQLPGDLIDVADDAQAPEWCGIDHLYSLMPLTDPVEMAGASCADFDDDGWVDVFLPGGKDQASKLYRNQGNGTFTDVAVRVGVDDPSVPSGTGVFADYDNDGDLDLFVAAHAGLTGTPGPLFRLFRNGGAAASYVFQNVSTAAGFVLAATIGDNDLGWQGGLAVGDYNLDGYLDLFATSWARDLVGLDGMWRLFKSTPNQAPPGDPFTPRVFVDATIEAGLNISFVGEPWQPTFTDVNRDGWPDLHICVDFDYDYMFKNDGDGTFSNVVGLYQLNGVPPEQRNEMGAAFGDVDNDGDFDLHVTNLFEADRFYRADLTPSGITFTDVALTTGLYDSPWGWGNIFFDFDNDGDLDHATVSGYTVPAATSWYNSFHINLYPQLLPDGLTVAWQTATYQVPDFSKVQTQQGDVARGLTWLDYDNDGDVDLVVARRFDKTALYKNTLVSPNRWLQVDLVEANGSLNTVGSLVWVKTSDRVQMREVVAGSSFLSQEPPRLHFGLGLAPPFPQLGAPPSSGVSGGTVSRGMKGGSVGGPAGGPATLGGSGPVLPVFDPAWLVVRWLDGSYQILMAPGSRAIVKVTRDGVNDAGDMNADGHLTAADQTMLLLAVTDPEAFQAAFPASPGMIVGDIDGDAFVEMNDYVLWSSLPPH